MYLDDIAQEIAKHLPQDRLPSGDSTALLRSYAALLLAKGSTVSDADVHDAWSAWMADRESNHRSLVKYEELSEDVRAEDRVFTKAIRAAAAQMGRSGPVPSSFHEVLFPSGPPKPEGESAQLLELYKTIVAVLWEIAETTRQGHYMFGIQINKDKTYPIPPGLPSGSVIRWDFAQIKKWLDTWK